MNPLKGKAMCKRTALPILSALVLLSCLTPVVRSATIAWVAANSTDDQSWVDLLTANGYTVRADFRNNEAATLDAAKIATLNAVDLIIISRNSDSGNYDDGDEPAQWNAIRTPILSLSAYMPRSSRWGWLNTSASPANSDATMEAVLKDHPIFRGVTLDASNQVDVITSAIDFPVITNAGNGVLIAKRADNSQVWIVEWEPGVEFYGGSARQAAGKRMMFAGRAGVNLTDAGTKVFLNAVAYMLGRSSKASDPSPASGSSDVPQDVVLAWTPVASAGTRNVYFGTSPADVEAASVAKPLDVLAQAGLDVNTFDPPGLLEFGKTYYWRVDEVNATPDATVFQGNVWSFTVEPYAYQLTGITATASSINNADMGPEKTIDGSGLDSAGLHGTTDTTMWLSNAAGPQPAWIEYKFDRLYKLQQMWVWNSNQSLESFVGIGARNVTIEYATDANDWQVLSGVPEFAQAPGTTGYAHNTTIDFGGVAASKVRLTINSNWGTMSQTGLSEVRFYQIPTRAREPQPATGTANVNPNDLMLHWRTGREAASHQVFVSTDSNAVANGSALIDTAGTNSYSPSALDVGETYFWRIDEVNMAASPSVWPGDVWNFSTVEYLVIDDFESYTNDSPDRVFQTWIDGAGFSADPFFPGGNSGNGSGAVVGYDPQVRDVMEKTIVHGGRQSMPVAYDNTGLAYSEAERTWRTAQNWTTNGADTLNLYFRGIPIGFMELSPNHILMNGMGTDIFGTADQGRFVYKQLSGDGTIIARVDRLDNTNGWAKAGVMIRQSPDPGSSWAFVLISYQNGVHFMARLAAGTGVTTDTALTLPQAQTSARTPVWVKLERKGDLFNGYYSTDGTTWTALAIAWNPQTISMTGAVGIGPAVTSHAAGVATQAEFSGIDITGNVTGSWQSVSLGVEQPAGNGADTLYIRLEDDGGHKATAINGDPYAVGAGDWKAWPIPMSVFTSAGIKTDRITKMAIGVGDKDKPASKAAGTMYIDDIGFGRSASQ
jgi:regulation of enolase protein 1 (concanavalin A-like superfamily)